MAEARLDRTGPDRTAVPWSSPRIRIGRMGWRTLVDVVSRARLLDVAGLLGDVKGLLGSTLTVTGSLSLDQSQPLTDTELRGSGCSERLFRSRREPSLDRRRREATEPRDARPREVIPVYAVRASEPGGRCPSETGRPVPSGTRSRTVSQEEPHA